MATKRLSRTIVEGGKLGSDKHERKQHIQKSRRIARDFCTTYYEDGNEIEPVFRARHYYREFGDRLAPLYKFLDSCIGTPWDEIYSKLCAIRSRDTIQGFHFIEHAKGAVFGSMGASKDSKIYSGYYIEDGLLQYKEAVYHRPKRIDKKTREIYERWIDNRKVRLIGTRYFWHDPVIKYELTLSWRQGNALTIKETGHMEWIKVRDYWFWRKLTTE